MAVVEDTPVREQTRLDENVVALLKSLRVRVRRYIWIEGIAATIAVLCLAFWVCLAIDWLFEPASFLRRALLSVGILSAATVFYRLAPRRLSVPLTDANMALVIERRFAKFDDSLLTAVSMAEREREFSQLAREMLAHTFHEAAARATSVELKDVFNRAPLARMVAVAGALVLSVLICAVAIPSTMWFGVERITGSTNELWPRKTRLLVPGFEEGVKVIAKGDDLPLLVQADTSMPLVPEVVQIRYRSDDGIRGRETLSREGNAVPGRDPYQDFRYTLPSVLASLSFDVMGGDARVRNLRVRVVESPTVAETTLLCEYPEYMGRAARELPVSGTMQLPMGTRITVRARANKDLIRAQIDYALSDGQFHTEIVPLSGVEGESRDFEFGLPALDADKTLAFTLFDTDGIHNRRPFVVALSAVSDEAPQLSLQLRGIGTAITPQARLPLAGKITDDYGVSSAAFQYALGEGEAQRQPLSRTVQGESEIEVDEAMEVRDLGLKPGQKLVFGAQASDAYHLAEGDQPHTATSDRFELDVVAPETLRAMLESRELNLRQRFETIISEVSETRDLLTRLSTRGEAEAAPETATAAGLIVERARQNSEKNAQETLGVANSFDEIREELINNRVDTEELKTRLKDNIADPLKVVVGEMFPEWDRKLKQLQSSLGKNETTTRRAALEQADAILVEMQRIRDKMLELESFNEAVDLLRSIIDSEKKLQDEARERQKRKVRELLEDSP